MATKSFLPQKKRYGAVICGGSTSLTREGLRRIGLYIDLNTADQEWKLFCAPKGEIPSKDDIDMFDGFWMFGSSASTSDSDTWIRELEAFIQTVAARSSPKPKLVGICFSHQLFAKALGGKVGRNPSNKYVFKNQTIVPGEELTAMGLEEPFNLLENHGECVLELPPGAKSLAKSNSCEHEIVLFRDNILGFQGHPDYSRERALEEVLPRAIERGNVSMVAITTVLKSFVTGTHHQRVNMFLRNFMQGE